MNNLLKQRLSAIAVINLINLLMMKFCFQSLKILENGNNKAFLI